MRDWMRGLSEAKQGLLVSVMVAVIVVGFVLLVDLVV